MELDELIKVARNCRNKTLTCDGCEYIEKEGKGGFCIDFLIDDLADALERLKRERDAAIKDFSLFGECFTCKHANVFGDTEPCKSCVHLEGGTSPNWEWRGVQDEIG